MQNPATGPAALAIAALLSACSAAPRAAEADPEAPPAAAIAVVTPPPQSSPDRGPTGSPDYRMSYERGPSEAFSFKNFTLDAEWIPAMWVTMDVDEKGAASTRAELDSGSGALLRAGLGSNQQNIGLLYMGTWHDESTTGRGASTQSLLLDFLYRAPIPEMNNQVWFEVDAGIGGTDLKFDSDQFDSQVTGSALLHGDLEFRITRAFTIAAGFGGFIWGNPGDTVAYGTYITLGAKFLF